MELAERLNMPIITFIDALAVASILWKSVKKTPLAKQATISIASKLSYFN
ncbi:MAG: hypothetical protein V6003_00090 [Candidatus Dasytiphilus stammeri]